MPFCSERECKGNTSHSLSYVEWFCFTGQVIKNPFILNCYIQKVKLITLCILQDLMKVFYKPKSAADKGTLFHIRNVFGHRGVTTKVMDCVNNVVDLVNFATDGLVCIALMNLLGWKTLDDPLPDWLLKDIKELGPRDVLNKLSNQVLDVLWPKINFDSIAEVLNSATDEEDTGPVYCVCGEGGYAFLSTDKGINIVHTCMYSCTFESPSVLRALDVPVTPLIRIIPPHCTCKCDVCHSKSCVSTQPSF